MFNCVVIHLQCDKKMSLCNSMWNQNSLMKVKVEGSKQVNTNMYDLLNVYQTTMSTREPTPIREVSSLSSLSVGGQMGSL